MKDEFFELVDGDVLDRYLEQKHGHEARERIEMPDTTKAELRIIIDGHVRAYNEALDNGAAGKAAVHYRRIQQLLPLDDDVAETFDQMQNPLAALFGGDGPTF